MQLHQTPTGPHLLPERFSDLTTAIRAVTAYDMHNPLVEPDPTAEERRLTLTEVIDTWDSKTGELDHYEFNTDESRVIINAMRRVARSHAHDWDEANAKAVLQDIGIETRRFRVPEVHVSHLLGRLMLKPMQIILHPLPVR